MHSSHSLWKLLALHCPQTQESSTNNKKNEVSSSHDGRMSSCEHNILGKKFPSVGSEEQGKVDLQIEQLQFAYGGDELQECHTISA